MAYRGVWYDGVDKSFGQNIPYDFDLLRDRTYQAFFDQAVLDSPEEEPPPQSGGENPSIAGSRLPTEYCRTICSAG